jgi:hypothetical protein
MPTSMIFDFFWGPDVGWLRSLSRLAIKIFVATMIAWLLHQCVFVPWFFPDNLDTRAFAGEVNKAFCEAGVGVDAKVEIKRTPTGLDYTVSHNPCRSSPQGQADNANPSGQTTSPPEPLVEHTFYDLTPFVGITRPHIMDSIDVLLRRTEAVWKGKVGQEKLLCAESRKLLDPTSCNIIENLRRKLLNGNGVALVQHLRDARWGGFLLGPVQLLTLAVFIFTAIETGGLFVRWLRAPSYIAPLVEAGLTVPLESEDRATFDERLEFASTQRVRAFVDRFLEKALSPSTTAAETRLRNYRDMLIDDCATHIDMLEMLGDTMLKIAFLGTVFGIGYSLFEARNLDAADPLVRLEAKSTMYAGIGMGFGATIVGIALSIFAAKLRTGLSAAWLADIDRAWRQATTFYDTNYRGAAAIPQPAVSGVDSIRRPYHPAKPKAKVIDRVLTFFGLLCILLIIAAVLVFIFAGAKSWSAF